MSKRRTKKKKQAVWGQEVTSPTAAPAVPYEVRRRELVLAVVKARKSETPEKVKSAEEEFITGLLGQEFLDLDVGARERVHESYRSISPLKRTEMLAMEIDDAVDALRNLIPCKREWELSNIHPFGLDQDALGELWGIRYSLDSMGVPYFMFAKVAALWWVFKKNSRLLPTVYDFGSTDILFRTFNFWESEDEESWDRPMREFLNMDAAISVEGNEIEARANSRVA